MAFLGLEFASNMIQLSVVYNCIQFFFRLFLRKKYDINKFQIVVNGNDIIR